MGRTASIAIVTINELNKNPMIAANDSSRIVLIIAAGCFSFDVIFIILNSVKMLVSIIRIERVKLNYITY